MFTGVIRKDGQFSTTCAIWGLNYLDTQLGSFYDQDIFSPNWNDVTEWAFSPTALPSFDSSVDIPATRHPKKSVFRLILMYIFLPPPPLRRMKIEWNYWIIRRFLFRLIFPLFIKFSNIVFFILSVDFS